MREVKIVCVIDGYYDSYGDDASKHIKDSLTDWETISDEDYTLLKDNFWRLQQKAVNRSSSLVLIEKDPVSVMERISSIKEWIQEERIRQEQEVAKRKAAAEEKALKRMMKKAGDEKRLLEELKKKYPDAV
jgi:hypothetical protein